MTALLEMAAAAVIGVFLGGVLMAAWAATAISHSQEKMQQKVRDAQDETARLREIAGHRGRELVAPDGWPMPASTPEWR